MFSDPEKRDAQIQSKSRSRDISIPQDLPKGPIPTEKGIKTTTIRVLRGEKRSKTYQPPCKSFFLKKQEVILLILIKLSSQLLSRGKK